MNTNKQNKHPMNPVLWAGIFLFVVVQLASYTFGLPHTVKLLILLLALVLEIWGVVLASRSSFFQNSKLRQWKLRLIGKAQK